MNTKTPLLAALSTLAAAIAAPARADVRSAMDEDFTGTTTKNAWYFREGACLTASTTPSTTSPGVVPGCVTIRDSYYREPLVGGVNGKPGGEETLPDPAGFGALRFTNGSLNGSTGGLFQKGAIFSKDTITAGEGLQVTFKTVAYRGNSRNGAPNSTERGMGADGIAFILMDGNAPVNLGSAGGSLGYSCSNVNPPYDGMVGGYLGVGLDEYGNFLNGAELVPGYTGPNTPLNSDGVGDNTRFGYGFRRNRIGLRGAGNTSWAWLNSHFPTFYPLSRLDSDALRQRAVQLTCSTGTLWNYGDPSRAVDNPRQVTSPTIFNYPPIAYRELPLSLPMARQYVDGGYARGDGMPIIYKLNLTQDGLLSLAFSLNGGAFQNVINKQSITESNGAPPSTFRVAFNGSSGGGSNAHDVLCFKAQPLTLSFSSTGVNERQSARVETGTQAFFAYYDPSQQSSGRLTASDLRIDTAGNVFVAEKANWDASCMLTGVATGRICGSTGGGPMAAIGSNNRTILTWNGTRGVPFRWTSLTTAQQNALAAGDQQTPSTAQKRLDYLRGQRTNEINTSGVGLFRARENVLGDIIDSSPTWVGQPLLPYTGNWKDRLYPTATAPEASGQTYAQFISQRQTRENVVYVGANDGFLHGFRSGAFDAAGRFDTSAVPNDGREALAYMPAAVVNTIHNATDSALDFSSPHYGHNYYVNTSPGTGEVFYGGAWHTWLFSGLGEGGQGFFALDITDPATTFQESRARDIVMGEWGPSTITCANLANCGINLGKTSGVPQIRRLHNGKHAVIFGNGIGSASGDAGIYIMTVDPSANAAKTFYYLSTGRAGNNGIAYVSTADLDGDHITDFVYAGDLLGNVWRFDLTGNLPSSWAVTSGPLFSTPAGQPITTRLVVASGITSAGQQLMVAFGTGRKKGFTNMEPVSYANGAQSLYGVWDWNLAAWNAKGSVQYASLTPADTGLTTPYTIKKDNLQGQTLTVAANGNRDIATNAVVCWKGTATCTGNNTKLGWFINLAGTNEQIVFNPQLLRSAFVVNSIVPANNSILQCTENTDKGFTYAVSVMTGGAFRKFFPQQDDEIAAGVEADATGISFPVTTATGDTWLVYQTVTNEHETMKVNLPPNNKANRVTWMQLR